MKLVSHNNPIFISYTDYGVNYLINACIWTLSTFLFNYNPVGNVPDIMCLQLTHTNVLDYIVEILFMRVVNELALTV